MESSASNDSLLKALADIASEAFRFERVFQRAMKNLDFSEQNKYTNQYLWFKKKIEIALSGTSLRVVSLEGQPFDSGMAVVPININEYKASDSLFIKQMVEPIIMSEGAVIKNGTVLLGRLTK